MRPAPRVLITDLLDIFIVAVIFIQSTNKKGNIELNTLRQYSGQATAPRHRDFQLNLSACLGAAMIFVYQITLAPIAQLPP